MQLTLFEMCFHEYAKYLTVICIGEFQKRMWIEQKIHIDKVILVTAQPAAYMYSVLYCLDKTISHTVRARDFVLEICGQLEDRYMLNFSDGTHLSFC